MPRGRATSWDWMPLLYDRQRGNGLFRARFRSLPAIGRSPKPLQRSWAWRVGQDVRTYPVAQTISLVLLVGLVTFMVVSIAQPVPSARLAAGVAGGVCFAAIIVAIFVQARDGRAVASAACRAERLHFANGMGEHAAGSIDHRRAELEARRRAWQSITDKRVDERGSSRFFMLSPRGAKVHSAAFLIMAAQVVLLVKTPPTSTPTPTQAGSQQPWWVLAPLPLVIAGIWLAMWWHSEVVRRRVHRTLVLGTCPDCEHDLRGIKPDVADFPELGPRLCPECASRWPLVPPAAMTFPEQDLEAALDAAVARDDDRRQA